MVSWQALSAAGALTVTGPLGAAIALGLMTRRAWPLALCWCALFGVAMALVVATKVAFMGWGVGVASLDFSGISGHAMRAAAVFPVAGYLAARVDGVRAALAAAGVLLALLVGISRLPLQTHSVSEVAAGCVLGWLVSGAFIWFARTRRDAGLTAAPLALCVLVVLLGAQSAPAPTQLWMRALAQQLAGHQAVPAPP